jgi:hypothetical protein
MGNMKITANAYVPVYGFLALVLITATAFLMLVHSMFTSHEVPEGLETDCGGAQVLDPVTHLCGGLG